MGARTWGALLGLALLSTALGFVIYFRVLATAGATNVMLVTLLMPVVALLVGSLILGEPVTGVALAGMAPHRRGPARHRRPPARGPARRVVPPASKAA